MGIYRDNGYSAKVEGYLILDGNRIRLAKTNGTKFTLAERCEAIPGSSGSLQVIVDGEEHTRRISLPDGIIPGQTQVNYAVEAPF